MFKYSTQQEKLNTLQSQDGYWRNTFGRIEIKSAIKVGIAAAIGLFVGVWFSSLFDRPDSLVSGLWCVVSAIVVVQAHLGGTYKAAWERFLGVLIGSILGCLFTSFFGSNPISLGLAVSLTVLICTFLNLHDSVRIACLSVTVIMVLSGLRPDVHLWWFGLCRFLDSCLGILIAVIVAHTIWPTEATNKIQYNMSKILTSLSKLFHLASDLEPDAERHDKLFYAIKEDVDELLTDSNAHLDEVKLELALRQSNLEDWGLLLHCLSGALDAIMTLKQLQKSKLMLMLDDSLLNKLHDFMDITETSFQNLSKAIEPNAGQKMLSIDTDLNQSYKELKEDLIRLRGTRTTRQFDWKEIESFFVYFYSIGMVAEELFQIQNLLPKILQNK